MTKTQKKKELLSLLVDFFGSENHQEAILINDKILTEVLSSQFSPKASALLNDSIAIWKVDVSNHLITFSDNNFYRNSAYLALRGIINLIDISELQD